MLITNQSVRTDSAAVDRGWFRRHLLNLNTTKHFQCNTDFSSYFPLQKVVHGPELTFFCFFKMANMICNVRRSLLGCLLVMLLLESSRAAWAATGSLIWNTAIAQTFSVTQATRYCSSQMTRVTWKMNWIWNLCISPLASSVFSARCLESVNRQHERRRERWSLVIYKYWVLKNTCPLTRTTISSSHQNLCNIDKKTLNKDWLMPMLMFF